MNQQLGTVSDRLWGEAPAVPQQRGGGRPCTGAAEELAEELRCSDSSSGLCQAGSQNGLYIDVV